MPFMQLKTNVAVTEQQETLLKTSFGSAITAIPVSYTHLTLPTT